MLRHQPAELAPSHSRFTRMRPSLQYLMMPLLTHGAMLRLTCKSKYTYLLLPSPFYLPLSVVSESHLLLSCPLTREILLYSMFQMGWTDPSATDAANALAIELRNTVVSTSGYSGLTTYVSYAHGEETLEQKYGANKLPRLQALKKKWDPRNVFAYNNAITPSR